jgi:hypothetical protein
VEIKLTAKNQEQATSPSPSPEMFTIPVIKLEPLESASTYYVNHIEVGSSGLDFSLIGGRLPGKLSTDQINEIKNDGAFVVEPDVQIVIPTTLIVGLIRALTMQKEHFEKIHDIQLRELGKPK